MAHKERTTDLRSFRAEWCDKYKWLHYEAVSLDSTFCHACMVAEFEKKFLASTKRDTAFTSTEFVEGNEHGLKYFGKSGKIQVTQSCVLSYVRHVLLQ